MALRRTTKTETPEDKFKDVVKCAYAGDKNDEYCDVCNGKFLEEEGKTYAATECQGYTVPGGEDSAPSPTPEEETKPAEEATEPAPEIKPEDTLTGTNCSVCGEPQFETPSGVTCKNGHGGAEEAPAENNDVVNDSNTDEEYVVRGVTKTIKAESGLSCELKDSKGNTRWYKFSYAEEREIPETADMEKEKAALWNTVNLAVDKQLEDTLVFLAAK